MFIENETKLKLYLPINKNISGNSNTSMKACHITHVANSTTITRALQSTSMMLFNAQS